jgi:hypothetical protein
MDDQHASSQNLRGVREKFCGAANEGYNSEGVL